MLQKVEGIYLPLLILVALYFQTCWLPGFFLDGGLYASLMQNAATEGAYLVPRFTAGGYPQFFEHPPTYFMLGGLFVKVFGASWTSVRFFSLLIFLLLSGVLYFKISKAEDKRLALITVVIFLLDPLLFKKARFPNLDVSLTLFTLLALWSYYRAFQTNKAREWLLLSLFWGGALLIKGHASIVIGIAIFFHILFTRNWKMILNYRLYLAFVGALVIFSLWPLALYLNGNLHGFFLWFNAQFISSVLKGRGFELDLLGYFKILLSSNPIWFILASWGTYKIFKEEKKDSIFILAAAAFWGILIVFSLMRLKYSHYIMPLLPFMAILAAYPIWKKNFVAANKVISGLTLIFAVIISLLLVFPLTQKISRDPEIHLVKSQIKYLPEKITAFAEVNESYGYWSFAAASAFPENIEIYRFSMNEFKTRVQEIKNGTTKERWLFWMNKNDYNKALIDDHELLRYLKPLVSFQKRNWIVLIENTQTDPSEALFNIKE